MLVVESIGVEPPVGIDSTKKLYPVLGVRPVTVTECEVELDGLQHGVHLGLAVPRK